MNKWMSYCWLNAAKPGPMRVWRFHSTKPDYMFCCTATWIKRCPASSQGSVEIEPYRVMYQIHTSCDSPPPAHELPGVRSAAGKKIWANQWSFCFVPTPGLCGTPRIVDFTVDLLLIKRSSAECFGFVLPPFLTWIQYCCRRFTLDYSYKINGATVEVLLTNLKMCRLFYTIIGSGIC